MLKTSIGSKECSMYNAFAIFYLNKRPFLSDSLLAN